MEWGGGGGGQSSPSRGETREGKRGKGKKGRERIALEGLKVRLFASGSVLLHVLEEEEEGRAVFPVTR